MSEEHSYEVDHVTIPGEVAFNPKLKYVDMFVFWVIKMINDSPSNRDRYFYGSNKWLAKVLGVTERTVIRSINSLINEGYLKRSIKNNNKRVLQIDSRYVKTKKDLISRYNRSEGMRGYDNSVTGGCQKCHTINNNKLKYTFIKNKSVLLASRAGPQKKRVVYKGLKELGSFFDERSEEVEKCIKYWNSLGKPFTSHKVDEGSKIIRRSRKLVRQLLQEGYKGVQIRKAMGDWHSLLRERNTVFNINYTYFNKKQNLPDFIKPDRKVVAQIQAHKPKLNMTSPFNEAIKGWGHLKRKYMKRDDMKRLTSAIASMWSNRHSGGSLDDFMTASKKWAARFDHWVIAYDKRDRLEYVINKIPTHYNSSYITSNQFWNDFVPEKLKEYYGG